MTRLLGLASPRNCQQARNLVQGYRESTANAGVMEPPRDTGRPLLSLQEVESRLVFAKCKPFILAMPGRQWSVDRHSLLFCELNFLKGSTLSSIALFQQAFRRGSGQGRRSDSFATILGAPFDRSSRICSSFEGSRSFRHRGTSTTGQYRGSLFYDKKETDRIQITGGNQCQWECR